MASNGPTFLGQAWTKFYSTFKPVGTSNARQKEDQNEERKMTELKREPPMHLTPTQIKQRMHAVNDLTQEQKARVEAAIHDRHATLVAAADKVRDEQLTLLQAPSTGPDSGLATDQDHSQENLNEATKVDQHVEQNVSSGAESAKEMKDRQCNQQSTGKLMSPEIGPVFHPHHRCTVTDDVIKKYMRQYIRNVEKLGTASYVNDTTVVGQFHCGEEKDIEVYSLCPKSNHRMLVSYARRGLREDAPTDKFDEHGKLVGTEKNATGKVSWKSTPNGRAMYYPSESGWVKTYSKSQTLTHLAVSNNLKGTADIWSITTVSENPLQIVETHAFVIKVGVHRAHDVDASEQLLAVVEEGQAPDLQRKVRMFRRPQKDAVATYSPATAAFQPSDICFYKLDGQHMLLVADELGDSIHVVNVQDNTMNFVRYLAPDCLLLVQPTALNVDNKGRLWVACRGGHILTIETTV